MAEAAKTAAGPDSKKVNDRRFHDPDRPGGAMPTSPNSARKTLTDRYLLPGESYQDLFARGGGLPMPMIRPTPSGCMITSRGCGSCPRPRCCRTAAPTAACRFRAISIRCPDSLEGIVGTWNENVWLASKGGGIGTYWGNVRGIGEPVGLNGKTSGIIPFVRVMDSLTLAISQGSLRRGSAACYLDVSHPEIEEFLEIRKPSGDFNRKALNLHHGVLLTDDFMEAVRDGAAFELKSPKTGETRATVDCALAVPEAGRNAPRHG